MSSVAYPTLCPNSGLENYSEIAGSNASHPDGGSDVTAVVSIATSLLSLAIVVGNGLIIMSVATVKKLRQPANYLIVSLALSDFLVGFIVLPITIVYDSGGEWIFGSMICDVHTSFDVICCTASIMNLCMISIDRYLMITKPMTYPQQRTGKLMVFMIATAWLISCLIILPALFGFTENVKDSPQWLDPIDSIASNAQEAQLTNIPNIYNPYRNAVDNSTSSTKKYQFTSFNIFNLGQPYSITKYRCSVTSPNSNSLQVLLQAETCSEEERQRTNEIALVSLGDLRSEVYVTRDVVGRYVKIAVNISDEWGRYGDLNCDVYGEKTRGKTCLISQEVWFTIYSTVGAFYLPLTVMLCMYWKIYVEASKFESQDRKQSSGSYSQDVSESPCHNPEFGCLNECKYSPSTIPRREININNNLTNSKNSRKFSNSESDCCLSETAECVAIDCFRTVKENGESNEESTPLHSLNADSNAKLSNFFIGETTDLGSQLSCCDDSNSKEDECLAVNLTPSQSANGNIKNLKSIISNSHPAHRKRKMSSPALFTPSSEFEIASDSRQKSYNRTLSANNISRKLKARNDFTSGSKHSRLVNGVSNGELKTCMTISENNVLELPPKQENKDQTSENFSENHLPNSYTKDTLSSETSTTSNRDYLSEKRYSIFSGSVCTHRTSHYTRSSSLARSLSHGAAQSYAKRRYSAGTRRTSSSSKSSQLGSDSNKKMKMFSQFRRRVSGATSRDRMRNVKATRTLGIIVGVFTFCWLPFFIVTILRPFVCEHPEAQDCIPLVLVRIVLWLGYLNSALNPLIYIGFSADLRKSFCYLLSCKCRNVDRRLAQNEFRRSFSREKKDSITSHQVAAESIM